MDKYLNKIMIIDGSYILHRSLKSPGLQDLTTTSGMKTGGVFGSLRILQSELKKYPGYFPIFCFDKGLATRRTELFPDYKANRKRQEADALKALGVTQVEDTSYIEEYHRQRSDLIMILRALGIPSLLVAGWEGDDLQYLLTKVCNAGIVVSDDKDMIQLVSPNIMVRRSMRDELIEWTTGDDYYKHPRFTIRKAIVGDPADNIPKCGSGLGEKGADQIAQIICSVPYEEYKSTLEKYCDDNPKQSIVKKIKVLLDNWDQFEINYKLTDLRLVEAPAGFEGLLKDLIKIVVGHPNIMKAYELIGQYEMNSIYPDQIISLLAPSATNLLLE